jgi:hypothetical protein
MDVVLGRFGDRRLEQSGAFLLGRLVEVGGEALRVRRLGGNRAGEMRITRFLRNPAVTVDEMFAEARARTAQRCADHDVLVIQDTTVIRSEGGGGSYLHVAIALDERCGTIEGLVDAQFLQRSSGRKALRRDLPIEEIEQVFRTCKIQGFCKTQGFDIEGLRIADPAPRERLVAATLIAALSIQQLVHARDGGPGPLRPHTDVFDGADMPLLEAFCAKLEGKTERQKNPHPKGSLAYAAWVCARLGGWTGYYGKPGPIVMLRGWLEIQAAKRAIQLLGSPGDV